MGFVLVLIMARVHEMSGENTKLKRNMYYYIRNGKFCHFLSADLCLTGLQISTNQRTTRKQLWRSIHSRAFRETKGIHAFEWFLPGVWYDVYFVSLVENFAILQAGL